MRTILVLCGMYYAIVGLLLWLVPEFFYSHIGHFGAYNAHYERDLGSFLLPLGLGCIYAAQAPEKHLLLLALAAGAGVLHAFSHLIEGLLSAQDALELLFFFAVGGSLCASLFYAAKPIDHTPK